MTPEDREQWLKPWAPGKFVQYDCTPSDPNNSFCADLVEQTTAVIERVMRFPSVF